MRPYFICFLAASVLVSAAADTPSYLTNAKLHERLNELSSVHGNVVRVRSIASSRNNNPVWLAELGSGKDEERAKRPAMLLVAGIEGNELAGTATAVAWITHLINDVEDRSLLEKTAIYIVPRVNPDAVSTFFEKPIVERTITSRPIDDDHDGLVDEDGPEDLNGDGLITWMRVQDPDGEYVLDPTDSRLLVKADRTKGEIGAWRYLAEGRDNDGDEQWNEDAIGGVNLNRNFPCGFKFFAPWSGLHPMSETETRALADFIVEHPNIGIVFTFGAADNLIKTPEGKEEGGRRPPTSLHKDDLPYYRELGKTWRDALGLKKELNGSSEPGAFSDWIYFHRGRLSLAARPWAPALQVELSKGDKKEEKKEDEKDKTGEKKEDQRGASAESAPKSGEKSKRDADNRNEDERAFLKWIDQHAPEGFVPWKEFEHPDFPGKKVEIGGFAPFSRINPPDKLLSDNVQKQMRFLTELAGKLPRVGIRSAKAKHLGNSVYELSVEIENTGYLPTALAQGQLTREVLPTRLTLDVPDAAMLSGSKRMTFDSIEGSGGKREARFIIHGKGRDTIQLNVVSTLGGVAQAEVILER